MESVQQQQQQQLEPASPKKRKPHEQRKPRVVVNIPLRRKDYIPGKGPALQRISLLPPRDSTAYILERIILPSPGLAADGNPLPRRMTYIVAWHDLPAAQLLVPAMDILEYVSPRELEDWEFANTEEQMEHETLKGQYQTDDAPKPKRRGRPPKHSKIETAVVAVPDDDDNAVQRGALTIATPTKHRLKDFEGLSDEDATPAVQLQWETTGESAGTEDQGLDGGGDSDGFGSTRAGAQTDQLRDSGSQYHESKQNHPTVIPIESSSSSETSSRQSTPKVTAIKSTSKGKKKEDKHERKTASNGVLNGLKAAESASGSGWLPQEAVSYSNPGVETLDPEPTAVTARVIKEAVSTQKKKSSKSTESEKHSKSESRKQKAPQPPQQDPVQSTEQSEEPDEPEQPDWEVKRIEGMEMYEAEGGDLVRYFKVRWEGDWPPDQNPTWEPESNLPDELVRRYLKNRKRKRPEAEKRTGGEKPKKPAAAVQPPAAPSYKPRKSMKQTTLSWGIPAKQFKSVAEAFEGLEEDELSMPQYDEAPIKEQGEDQDELFVVEEPPTKKSRVKTWVGNGLDLA